MPALDTPASREQRSYFFDFSHFDTVSHDLVLIAGARRVRLEAATAASRAEIRARHPILNHVPDAHLTHSVTLPMPSAAVQLCYVQRIAHGRTDGAWDMAFLFYHLPSSSLRAARHRAADRGLSAVPVKWRHYGITAERRAELDDPVGETALQDSNDQATAMVAGHPELTCGEPDSAAHIQGNIISTQSSTASLGNQIAQQGPATPEGGWATQTPLLDPDGAPYQNSAGQIQYVPVWSDTSSQSAAGAISPALSTVKDDTTLGANLTTIDPTEVAPGDPASPTNGSVWALQDGATNVDAQASPGPLGDTAIKYQFSDQTPGYGYSVSIGSVWADDSGQVHVSFTARNSYLRYLSLYVRYLDGNGQPIALDAIADEISSGFPNWGIMNSQNGTYDAYLDMLGPQFNFMGIPCSTTSATYMVPVPSEAVSILILAGGLGNGSAPYPSTLTPGVVMTALYNLSIPTMMLALNAAAGFGMLTSTIAKILPSIVPLAVDLFAGLATEMEYNDPEVFVSLGVSWGQILLASGAMLLVQPVAEAIAEGETVAAVLDAIPFVGQAFSAIFALGLVFQLEETSAQISTSPKTYVDKISMTHDVVVTIAHDPKDAAGFPATATTYLVTALFDSGTPYKLPGTMPSTTLTDPITVTFAGVPAGGKVKVDVGFYSDTNYLVGQGTIGPVANTASAGSLPLAITITELKVPLTASTVYTHKEFTQLDQSGNHVWQASTTPPATATPSGYCDNVNGHICSWTGITLSSVDASVGYAWQAYNSAVHDCVNGGLAQLYQFANLSTTQAPQASYFFSGCGFSGVTRLVYDLMGGTRNFYLDPSGGNFFIRQIHLTAGGVTSYDSPTSNKAFGRLRYGSDAMLLHPLGKILSVNTSLSKLEVLDLLAAPVADADAPFSQVYSGSGTRAGLMNAPVLAAVTAQGTILVLEQDNARIQAFDLGANPVPCFAGDAYYVPLKDPPESGVQYLDLAVEYSGYMYVLSYTGTGASYHFRLDLYTPDGAWLARTDGVIAAKLVVNYWRDLFTLNYQVLTLPNGTLPARTEPSVSHWIPSTP